MKKPLIYVCLLITIISCTKSDLSVSANVTATTQLAYMQNKWTIDSVYIYPASGLSSGFLLAYKATDTQYIDFRADGKAYSYGGMPTITFDTSTYQLLADNKTFLVNVIKNGVVSTKSDTGYILKLNANAFVYYTRNPAREYGKAVLKR